MAHIDNGFDPDPTVSCPEFTRDVWDEDRGAFRREHESCADVVGTPAKRKCPFYTMLAMNIHPQTGKAEEMWGCWHDLQKIVTVDQTKAVKELGGAQDSARNQLNKDLRVLAGVMLHGADYIASDQAGRDALIAPLAPQVEKLPTLDHLERKESP